MCHYRSNIKKRNCVEIPPLVPVPTSREVRGLSTCAIGPSYFVYLTSNNTNLLSYLRDGSETNTATVSMNYCKPFLDDLPSSLTLSEIYTVTGHIVSSQSINDGLTVKYQAGTFIELNNGFYSGTDFVAEINPCVITRTVIAAKTDDVAEEVVPDKPISLAENTIKIYPTILPSGHALKIEVTEDVKRAFLVIYDLQSKTLLQASFNNVAAHTPNSVSLTGLSSGLYIVKAIGDNVSTTQKIIIE